MAIGQWEKDWSIWFVQTDKQNAFTSCLYGSSTEDVPETIIHAKWPSIQQDLPISICSSFCKASSAVPRNGPCPSQLLTLRKGSELMGSPPVKSWAALLLLTWAKMLSGSLWLRLSMQIMIRSAQQEVHPSFDRPYLQLQAFHYTGRSWQLLWRLLRPVIQ